MAMGFKGIKGGLTAPQGFVAGAIGCGIKNASDPRLDLALICNAHPGPGVATGVFTTNRVKAAPVRVSMDHLRRDEVRAIVVNSGNANACTGVEGIDNAKKMARAAAKALGLRQRQVMVCSTGIIGLPLPMDRIVPAIEEVSGHMRADGGADVAKAIMTSDTRPKEIAVQFEIDGHKVRIGACSKGAGMICPSMATMLCFITTDANIGRAELQKATQVAVEQSFNRITIDGDMSTNDTVIVLANGKAGNPEIRNGSPAGKLFREALSHVMLKMAKAIVADGERVTKFVEVAVKGAATYTDARKVSEAIAKSALCKCSWNGGDANWGRIMDAVGYSGARIREELIDIYFDGVAAARHGVASSTPVEKLRRIAANPAFTITVDMHLGGAEYTVYTSDFSPEFVDFNRSEYAAWKKAQAPPTAGAGQ